MPDQKNVRVAIILEGSLGDSLMALPTIRLVASKYGWENTSLISLDPNSTLNASSILGQRLPLLKCKNVFRNHPIQFFRSVANWLEVAWLLLVDKVDVCIYALREEDPEDFESRSKVHSRILRLSRVKVLGLERKPINSAHGSSHKLQIGLATFSRICRALDLNEQIEVFDFSFPSSAKDKEVAENWLSDRGISDSRCVAICNSSKTAAQRWPLENFEAVVTEITKLDPEMNFVLVGSSEDSAEFQSLRKVTTRLHALGQPEVGVSAEVMRRCIAYLGNDTGPMHLAASVGTKCFAIFSGRNPKGEWYPLGAEHFIHESSVECAGCRLSECSEFHYKCLTKITPQQVMASWRRRFDKGNNLGVV